MDMPETGGTSEGSGPLVSGNAPLELKAAMERIMHIFAYDGFGTRTAEQLKLVEVSVVPNADELERQETKVILETTVTEDMLNPTGRMHGACIVHLVDICTSLPVAALSLMKGGDGFPRVSQSINVLFHAPASLGDKLKLVNTSVAFGARVSSARIEIWDVTHHRLVASGTQAKMDPKL